MVSTPNHDTALLHDAASAAAKASHGVFVWVHIDLSIVAVMTKVLSRVGWQKPVNCLFFFFNCTAVWLQQASL